MTFLGNLNYYLLQFLFIRLTRHQNRVITKFDIYEISITNRGPETGGKIREFHFVQYYSLMYWVVPFTGWGNDYKYLSKVKYLRLTKDRIVN